MSPSIPQDAHDNGLAALRRYGQFNRVRGFQELSLTNKVQEGVGSVEDMRLICRQQLVRMDKRISGQVSELQNVKMKFVHWLKSQPIAKDTNEVDSRIYETDIELWKLRLGPRMKFSTGYWPQSFNGACTLANAELAMLEIYAERAQLEDGQDVLDLGCGYGSTAFYLAERFPHSRIFALTITASQIDFLRIEMSRRALTNIFPIRADINTYEAVPDSFDRIISIELLEYLLNYDLLFAKLSTWLRPAGLLFIEFTTHATTCYDAKELLAEYTGEETYLSADLLHYFQRHLTLKSQWWVNGKHYATTFDAWLERLSTNREHAMELLLTRYGIQQAGVKYRSIEWYLWVSSEEYAFKEGNSLGISHYLFSKTEAAKMSMSDRATIV